MLFSENSTALNTCHVVAAFVPLHIANDNGQETARFNMNPEENHDAEKAPEAPQNSAKQEVEESVQEAPDKDTTNESSSASLANAFVVGTNLSLSSSRDETNAEKEASSNLIVEEEGESEETNENEETNEPENEATSPARSLVTSQHSLMDDDSEEVSQDEIHDEETSQATSSSTNNNRGAQILRNRWSSWQKKANETVNQAIKNPRFTKNIAADNTTDDGSDSISPASSDSTIDSSLNSTREQQASAARTMAVKVAASSVVDTVASGFRGRYALSGGASAPATPEPKGESKTQTMTPSQTALIMQSRAKEHMQSILDSLEPQEYVMLLGNGMLGVNLKQAYLKNNGVYIDFLVEGGSAELSGVVSVGDNLMKVGNVNVFRRGLIVNVPQTIAAAKRPVVLVFSTGQDIPLERMNYIDVAAGMMHKIREEKNSHRDIATLPIQASDEVSSVGENASVQTDGSTGEQSVKASGDNIVEEKPIDVTVPPPSFEGPNPMHLATPPLALREMVSPHVAKR